MKFAVTEYTTQVEIGLDQIIKHGFYYDTYFYERNVCYMTQKMLELTKRAEQGDVESQYSLGWAYKHGEDGFEKDIEEALKWLIKAADKNKGNHSGAQRHLGTLYSSIGKSKVAEYWLKLSGDNGDKLALFGLISVYFRYDAEFPGDCSKNVHGCLKKLFIEHKDPVAMVVLGAIYCGSPYDKFISKFDGLVSYCNPKVGFDLIERGVILAESADENWLGYDQYDQIYGAYAYDMIRASKNDLVESHHFVEDKMLVAIDKKISYGEKALAALKRESSYYPKEYVDQMLPEWEKRINLGKEELQIYEERDETFKRIQRRG